MALRPRSMAFSILLQALLCAVALVAYSGFYGMENVFNLYDEQGTSSPFILVMGCFTKLLVFGLPVFLGNYYFAYLCFKSRPVSFPLIAINIISMFACNALYIILIFKVIAGESIDNSAVILALTGIVTAFLMEWGRHAIKGKPA